MLVIWPMQVPHYQKPYKTYDEQLSIIEERGILVADREDAIIHLKRLGYYRLSGYWYPFRHRKEDHREGIDRPDDKVVEGVSFSDIVAICDFDGRLRNTLMEAISSVEVAVRVAVAYQMGKYGPLGYLDRRNLGPGRDNPSRLDPSITDFEQFCQKQWDAVQGSKEAFARHFRDIYDGECPVWAAIELWDFGTLSRFYQMMAVDDRKAVAREFGFTGNGKLGNWLECLNDLRNFSAHQSRLNRRHFPKGPAFPWSPEFPQFAHLKPLMDRSRHRLYPLMCILVYLMDRSTPQHEWRRRFIETMAEVDALNGAQFVDYGIPETWLSEQIWSEHSR